jgi:predicted ArsR family transcriptional regulator
MTKVTDAAIVALLRARPGLTAGEIDAHFELSKAATFGRLIKLAARNVIRSETQSVSVRAGRRRETTGAQVRRYFPPVALVAAE